MTDVSCLGAITDVATQACAPVGGVLRSFTGAASRRYPDWSVCGFVICTLGWMMVA